MAGEGTESGAHLDVLIAASLKHTRKNSTNDPVLSTFFERCRLARTQTYGRALAAIDSARFARFLLECAEQAQRRLTGGADPASNVIGPVLDRLRRQLRKRGGDLALLDAAARHNVRVGAKTLYYASELFAGAFGRTVRKRRRRFLAALRALHDTLGNLSDLTSARQLSAALAGEDAAVAFRAGRLVGIQDRDEPQSITDAVLAYKRWCHVGVFWD